MPSAPAGGRYGARGGNWLPGTTPATQDAAFAAAADRGEVVHVRCQCGYWWLIPSTAAKPCERCGERFVRVTLPRSA